ncbi:hypothetical protein Pan241w_52810 [Gimesia alba]|uniref:Uncharacterized protein n=1 Tax=Gimesia alba TaxID=2527973 RepID=A0A517RMX2_9PLAN|nr:hypothetical protein Pan241w_52810 [Gimesia alba]
MRTGIGHENLFGRLPFGIPPKSSDHLTGIDILMQLSKSNQSKTVTPDNIKNTQIIPESEFLKLLRTRFNKSVDQSRIYSG